jgi:hypothetical protein
MATEGRQRNNNLTLGNRFSDSLENRRLMGMETGVVAVTMKDQVEAETR